MIEGVLPDVVRTASTRGELDIKLFPAESKAIATATNKRRTEFTTVRGCARAALRSLGVAAAPLVPGDGGASTWPDGVVGSMTHCAGYRAAAVAWSSAVLCVGIDAEPNAALPDGVLPLIGRSDELRSLPTGDDVAWDRLLFSAKESVYKMSFPRTGTFFGFAATSVSLERTGTFRAQLLFPAPASALPREVRGRWLAKDGLLVTAVSVLG